MTQRIVLADTDEGLAAALGLLDDLPVVGVDVERADSDRYWRAAALIQVGGGDRVALVDPLSIADLAPLARFLADRVTVLHAMDNDLNPLETAGASPGRVEDTAVAAAILGQPTGLGDLLAKQLGIELSGDKQAMQRADWAARPLSDEMRIYAAEDVVHLPELWSTLATALEERGRTSWYVEERDWIANQPAAEERRDWTRTRGVGRLDPRARARARSLWETRERLARSTDTAPGRILPDRTLVELATEPVGAVRELMRRGVRRAAVRRFGVDLFGALEDPGDVESVPRRRRMSDQQRAAVDRLRSLRTSRARELDIDPGVLCPNRVLGAAVLDEPSTPEQLRQALGLRRWQWEQVGASFCEELGVDGAGKPAPPAAPDPHTTRETTRYE